MVGFGINSVESLELPTTAYTTCCAYLPGPLVDGLGSDSTLQVSTTDMDHFLLVALCLLK
jgi:hypothetical protein